MNLDSLLPDDRATELLRAMLLDGAPAREAWSRWSRPVPDPVRALGEDAILARPLLPLLYDSVRRNALLVDGATATYLRSAFLTESLRSRSYREIVAALRSHVAGLRVLFVKGAAVGELYYSDLALRHAHDIELLAGEPGAVRSALAGTLFRAAGADFVHASGLPLRVHAQFYVRFRESLDAAEHLAITLIHASLSPSRASARWVCDAHAIVRAGSVDWPRFAEIVISNGAAIPIAVQLHWLRETIGVYAPSDVLVELDARAARASRRERAQVRTGLRAGHVSWLRRLWRRAAV